MAAGADASRAGENEAYLFYFGAAVGGERTQTRPRARHFMT